ncbi:hypothetical protein NE237_022052 [Protea cynaroides]|uniref:Uncharacterized protein n=1 Tax=Protea cynaroides TaxID=273540 RepID=A0A9Q0JTE4_9MAGN|nr:hypothetical protein NE237_022052 [Protea cynaroides]
MGNRTIYGGGNENGVAARICYNLAMAIGFKYDGNSFDNGTNALQYQSSLPNSKNKSNGLVKGQPIVNHVLCIEKSVVRKKPKFLEIAARVYHSFAFEEDGSAMAQENATSCLGNLVSSSDQDLKLLVARESGIKCPRNYWEAAPSVRNLKDVCNGVTCIALFWLDGCPDGFVLFVCFIWAIELSGSRENLEQRAEQCDEIFIGLEDQVAGRELIIRGWALQVIILNHGAAVSVAKSIDAISEKHTFLFVLKACAFLFAVSKGKQIHAYIVKSGLDKSVYMANIWATQCHLWILWKKRKKLRKKKMIARNEDLLFVVAEPFEDHLILSAEDLVGDDNIGRMNILLNSIEKHVDERLINTRWFNLEKQVAVDVDQSKEEKFATQLYLQICLDDGYHVLDETTHYSSELRPTVKQLWKYSIGVLELGILNADGLHPMKIGSMKDNLIPKFNKQYSWEVYDPSTVASIGVFNTSQLWENGTNGNRVMKVGKLRTRVSTLECETGHGLTSKHGI